MQYAGVLWNPPSGQPLQQSVECYYQWKAQKASCHQQHCIDQLPEAFCWYGVDWEWDRDEMERIKVALATDVSKSPSHPISPSPKVLHSHTSKRAGETLRSTRRDETTAEEVSAIFLYLQYIFPMAWSPAGTEAVLVTLHRARQPGIGLGL